MGVKPKFNADDNDRDDYLELAHNADCDELVFLID